jgi:hypothetical protein
MRSCKKEPRIEGNIKSNMLSIDRVCKAAEEGTRRASETDLLDLGLDGQDLGVELSSLVGSDRGGDDGSGDTAGSAEGGLRGEEDVGDVLVLAQEGKVEENLDGLGVLMGERERSRRVEERGGKGERRGLDDEEG